MKIILNNAEKIQEYTGYKPCFMQTNEGLKMFSILQYNEAIFWQRDYQDKKIKEFKSLPYGFEIVLV